MSRTLRTLIMAGSLSVILLVVSLERASGLWDYPCYACVLACISVDQDLACEEKCDGMVPAHYHQCLADEYEFCPWTYDLITECEDVG